MICLQASMVAYAQKESFQKLKNISVPSHHTVGCDSPAQEHYPCSSWMCIGSWTCSLLTRTAISILTWPLDQEQSVRLHEQCAHAHEPQQGGPALHVPLGSDWDPSTVPTPQCLSKLTVRWCYSMGVGWVPPRACFDSGVVLKVELLRSGAWQGSLGHWGHEEVRE